MTINANSPESVTANVVQVEQPVEQTGYTEQGAAEAILNLMNQSQEEETTQQDEPTSEEQVEESSDEQDVEDTDSEEESQDEESSEEQEEEEQDYFQVTVKDEEGNDVQEEVSTDELISGYMRNKDYHRKRTMEAKQVKEQVTELSQVRDNLESMLAANISLDERALQTLQSQLSNAQQNRPDLYPELHYKYLQLSQSVEQRRGTLNQLQQSYLEQRNAEESSKFEENLRELQTIYPDWESKQQELTGYLANQGFTDNDVRGMVNPKIVELVEKAMAYDSQQATLKDAGYKKLKRKVPKVLKGGTGNVGVAATKRKAITEAQQRVRKTGSVDDAANAIYSLMNQK